jgi:geranylgeranyl diphosphate synthase type I
MLRPLLCLLSCGAVGGKAESALPAAAALEFLHNFSLIHDDIEDCSSERHGRETVWKIWGVPLAVNAGDGMFALAHVTLERLAENGLPAEKALELRRLLDVASLELCEGQYLDLEYERRLDVTCKHYLDMAAGKTSALMSASSASGAVIGRAPADIVVRFQEFGRNLGFAFQIRDDILGIWGKSREMGKPTGEDIYGRKKSFPVVFALERSRGEDAQRLRSLYEKPQLTGGDVEEVLALLERVSSREESQKAAARYASRALNSLRGVEMPPESRRDLKALADYFVEREA